MTIAVYDTHCGSLNSGDAIIMDAVLQVLDELFPLKHKVSYPTHYALSISAIKKIKKSYLSFVGGSNLLSSTLSWKSRKNQWSINYIGANILKNHAVLLGCGWKGYQPTNSLMSKIFYKTILSYNYNHSVRDSYTEKKFIQMGLLNVINTGCPTMWGLTQDHCLSVPSQKSVDVIFTLTDYRRDPIDDFKMIKLLENRYRRLYFWAQGSNDLKYLCDLISSNDLSKIKLIGPSLFSYDHILKNIESIDYVGTRLHAGIRAIQMRRRAIIIGVDNRAVEKRKDFNLHVIDRGDLKALDQSISNTFDTRLLVPFDKIKKWKSQFLTQNV